MTHHGRPYEEAIGRHDQAITFGVAQEVLHQESATHPRGVSEGAHPASGKHAMGGLW
jgi:hypothetical protein